MKVAQNDETNAVTQPVRLPHIPSIVNAQLSPSGSSGRKRETSGYFSGCFPPSSVSPPTALGIPSTAYCLIMFCDALFALYLLFLPPLLSLDTETDAAATQ